MPTAEGRVIVITGAMAAGKSTVAEAQARRLPASAYIRGDVFRKMIVSGRAELPKFLGPIQTVRRHLVVLAPSVAVLESREEQRAKTGYLAFSRRALDQVLREETPPIGYWLDSSEQTPAGTVEDILNHLDRALV